VVDVVVQAAGFLAALGRAHDQLRHDDQVVIPRRALVSERGGGLRTDERGSLF
jgi:hypothetical protein